MTVDNLSANKTPAIRSWAGRANIELCFTPTSASWANPIEAQFGPLRTFVMGETDHPNHAVLARRLQHYLRWRNANARHPDILAAQRKERARIRSANATTDGAAPGKEQHDQTRQTFMDSALAGSLKPICRSLSSCSATSVTSVATETCAAPRRG